MKKSSDDMSQDEQPSVNPSQLSQQQTQDGEVTFEQFLKGNIKIRIINIVKSLFHPTKYEIEVDSDTFPTQITSKRYSDFLALHQAIKQKYEQADLPLIPSKMQIVGKTKKRSESFQQIFAKIMQMGEFNMETRKKTRRILYNFLFLLGKNDFHQLTPNKVQQQYQQSQLKQAASLAKESGQKAKGNGKDNLETLRSSESSQFSPQERPKANSQSGIRLFCSDVQADDMNNSSENLAVQRGKLNSITQAELKQVQQLANTYNPQEVFRENSMTGSQILEVKNQLLNNRQGFQGSQSSEDEEEGESKIVEKRAINNEEEINSNQQQQTKTFSKFNPIKTFKNNIKSYQDKQQSLSQTLHKEILYERYLFVNFFGQKNERNICLDDWKEYNVKVTESEMLLFKKENTLQGIYDIMISTSYCISRIQPNGEYPYYEINHPYDKYKLLLASYDPREKNISNDMRQQALLNIFTLDSKVKKKKEIINQELKPTGKLMIEVKDITNFGFSDFSYFVQISHFGQVLYTNKREPNHEGNIRWNQKLYLPILNNYSTAKLELIKCSLTGWIKKEQEKQELLHSMNIQIPDILTNIYKYGTFTLILDIPVQHNQKEPQNNFRKLKLRIENCSTYMSYICSNQHEKYEELDIQEQLYERFWLKTSVNRFKRMKVHTNMTLKSFSDILNFKYQKLSYIVYTILTILMLFFNLSSIVNCIVVMLLFVILYNSEIYNLHYKKQIEDFLLNERELHPYYFEPKVLTLKQVEDLKFLNKFQVNVIKSENMYAKYKKIKNYLAYGQYKIFLMTSFFEKLKNLLIWEHPAKTKIAMLVLFAFFIVYNIIPFREIFVASDFIPNLKIPDEKFPSIYTLGSFQKALSDNLKNYIGLSVPEDLLLRQNTVNKLVEHYSACATKLYVDHKFKKTFRGQYTKLFKKKNILQKISKIVYNFLYNIPSDFFRIRNPQRY